MLKVHRWIPPAVGQFKLNLNATVSSEGRKVGIGVVIRDSSGVIYAALAQSIPGPL